MGAKAKKYKSKNKIQPGVIGVAILVSFIIFAFFFIISDYLEKERTAASGAKIYFFDVQSSTLKPEPRPVPAEISSGTNTDKVKFVLEELSVGPKTSMLQPSVPSGLIKQAAISGNNVDVEVSSDYYRLKSGEEVICRAAIVYTLAELIFVETVSFSFEGSELLKPNGQPLGKTKVSDIVLTPDINPQGQSPRALTLYFADSSGTGLVSEARTILVNPNESVAKYIVAELIRGPSSPELLPTVPPETKLLDLNVTDGVCYLDLSKEFITRHTGGPDTEILTIYSIVNSLTELSDIKNVQFMIEGKRQESFKEETGFNNLYEAMDIPPAGAD